MTYFVVIDTNVLVSALLSKHEDASTVQVINALFDGTIIPIFSNEILSEYNNVLHRPKFHFQESDIQNLLQTIRTHGIFTERLFTGNIKHFPKEPFIVTPNELLEIIK